MNWSAFPDTVPEIADQRGAGDAEEGLQNLGHPGQQ